jgi:hypothetical protein
MDASCMTGKEIVIVCTGFLNPIYQDQWDNFYIETYDSERQPHVMEKSNPVIMDCRDYAPAEMPKDTL